MAGLFDLLKLLVGAGGTAAPDAATPPLSGDFGATPPAPVASAQPLTNDIGAPPSPGGVSGALSAPPPPAPAAAIPQPSTPPSTDQGLGGFLSRMVDKATTRNADTGMSFMDRFGDLGATMTDLSGTTDGAAKGLEDSAAARVKATQDDARRQKLQAMADSLGMSPREKLIFAANPEAWVKANAERLGYHEQAGGTTGNYGEPGQPGSTSTTAPLIGQEGGEGYKVAPTGMTDLGGVAASPQQQLQDKVRQAQEEALAAYHRSMVGVAQQNANTNQQRAKKPAGLGNGGDWRTRVVGHGSVQ